MSNFGERCDNTKYNFIEIILSIFELLNNPIGITSIIRNIVFDNVSCNGTSFGLNMVTFSGNVEDVIQKWFFQLNTNYEPDISIEGCPVFSPFKLCSYKMKN